MGRQAEAPKTMAAQVALKPEAIEKAIQSIVARLPKDIAQRDWTKSAHASLTVLVVENSGLKMDKAQKEAIYKNLLDSDIQYSSNMRAYLVKRGILPAKPAVQEGGFLG